MAITGRLPYPYLYQINISDGGVPKRPVLEAVITKAGVEGDRQQNLQVHGGPIVRSVLFARPDRAAAGRRPFDRGRFLRREHDARRA